MQVVTNYQCMVHNVLSKMWGVCIMASIWVEYRDSSQKGNIVFVRKGDHKVELSVKTCGLL